MFPFFQEFLGFYGSWNSFQNDESDYQGEVHVDYSLNCVPEGYLGDVGSQTDEPQGVSHKSQEAWVFEELDDLLSGHSKEDGYRKVEIKDYCNYVSYYNGQETREDIKPLVLQQTLTFSFPPGKEGGDGEHPDARHSFHDSSWQQPCEWTYNSDKWHAD